MQLKQTAESLWSDAKTYWKHPPAGKYMPFKEIAAYSVGGIGAYFIITIIWALQLSVGNFIIGNAIGIEPTKIYLLYLISVGYNTQMCFRTGYCNIEQVCVI